MSTLKDFRYEVSASTLPRRRVRLTSEGKAALEAATPPEFRGGTPGIWSPEDLLVAAVTSCYSLTLEAIAAHRGVELRGVEVRGVGHVTRRAEGRVGFVVIELAVDLAVAPGSEHEAERAAHSAKQACLVAHALEIPIELELNVHTPASLEAAALG
jgi:organic hydroperoxide reductase OsmC/OhrA